MCSFQISEAQVIDNATTKTPQELYDFHYLMQKKKKTTAWILLGSGIAMVIGSYAILENNGKEISTDIFTGKNSSSG